MNNNDLNWPEAAQAPFTQAIGDGVIAGIQTFAVKNKLNTDIGAKHTNPLHELVLRFTAEMQDGDQKTLYKRVFPFKNSFRSIWEGVIVETSKVMVAMWGNKEEKEAIALARTVSYLETLRYLDTNKDEVIAEYHAIRGGDFIMEEVTEKNLLPE
jgi:hypothetical protein